MARHRTIKPEFWTSLQVVDCSTTARLLFIGLWNFADDQGVYPIEPMKVKIQIFPADPFSPAEIEVWLAELENAGLLRRFSSEGVWYYHITGWHHQKIDKPRPVYPTPNFDDSSTTPPRRVDDSSPTPPRPVEQKEGKKEGKELKKEGKEGGSSCSEINSDQQPPDEGDEMTDIVFPTVGGDDKRAWILPVSVLDGFVRNFPGIDVMGEILKARSWCESNPRQRKTPNGMTRFLNGWMTKAQNQNRNGQHGGKQPLLSADELARTLARDQ